MEKKHSGSLESFIEMSMANALAAETQEDARDWIKNHSFLVELKWYRENFPPHNDTAPKPPRPTMPIEEFAQMVWGNKITKSSSALIGRLCS